MPTFCFQAQVPSFPWDMQSPRASLALWLGLGALTHQPGGKSGDGCSQDDVPGVWVDAAICRENSKTLQIREFFKLEKTSQVSKSNFWPGVTMVTELIAPI